MAFGEGGIQGYVESEIILAMLCNLRMDGESKGGEDSENSSDESLKDSSENLVCLVNKLVTGATSGESEGGEQPGMETENSSEECLRDSSENLVTLVKKIVKEFIATRDKKLALQVCCFRGSVSRFVKQMFSNALYNYVLNVPIFSNPMQVFR